MWMTAAWQTHSPAWLACVGSHQMLGLHLSDKARELLQCLCWNN